MAEYYVSSHAKVARQPKIKVPDGCTMYFYDKPGQELPHDLAFAIFDQLAAAKAPGGKVVHTIYESGTVDDYAVWHLREYPAYSGVFTFGTNYTAIDISTYTEQNPIYLSTIFTRLNNLTAIYWLACR